MDRREEQSTATAARSPSGRPASWGHEASARRRARLISCSRILGALVAAIAALVLAGWLFHVPVLTQIVPGWTPMRANGALGLLLETAALLLLPYGVLHGRCARRTERVGVALAAAVLILGIATLAEYALGRDFSFDDLLVSGPPTGPTRMAPRLAAALALLGAARIFRGSKRRALVAVSEPIALAALAISLVAVVGYLYNIPSLYRDPPYVPIAPHAALALLLLTLGLLFARPEGGLMGVTTESGAAGSTLRRLLPTAIGIPVLLGGLHQLGERAGLFGPAFGTALFAFVVAATFAAFAYWHARDLVRWEATLRDSEARLFAVVDTAVDAILTIDERGVVLSINPAGERLFGYRAEEVVGRNVSMLMPESHRSEHDLYLARYRRTGEARIIGIGREVQGRRKDAVTFPVELSVSEVHLGDRRIYAGILRDISERKRTEAEREALLSSERAARSLAERATQLKDEFVATVSHELRSPLNAILGWSQMLRRGRLDANATVRAIEVIERNARVQGRLIEDLLDMSRILSGKLRVEAQPVDLAGVVEDATASAAPAAVAKGVHLEKEIDRLTGSADGDPGRLTQVMENLLSNAIKFTPRGGHVHVILRRAGPGAEIIVRDDGKGIAADFLPFVFDRFRQADSSLTRSHGGLGLGLALVKHVVELHGGQVYAQSEGEGRGATFTVSLPVTRGAAGASERPMGEHGSAEHPEGARNPTPLEACGALAGVKVLVVDDEQDARDLVCRILASCKAEVVGTASAREALEAFQSLLPDVLVSDIGMPELDGYHLIREVRALGAARGGETPAVALSAFSRTEDQRRALDAGYQVHIAKPVDQARLILVVATVAGRLAVT
jgi:PAS domain S-box-containing protein